MNVMKLTENMPEYMHMHDIAHPELVEQRAVIYQAEVQAKAQAIRDADNHVKLQQEVKKTKLWAVLMVAVIGLWFAGYIEGATAAWLSAGGICIAAFSLAGCIMLAGFITVAIGCLTNMGLIGLIGVVLVLIGIGVQEYMGK